MLSVFSKYRSSIERKFEPSRVSNDLKVIFLEQHSMKLGNAVFYSIEAKRQSVNQALEAWPVFGGFLSIFFFTYYAYKRPLSRKLYKEAVQSLFLGMLTASPSVLYYRWLYLKEVDVQYNVLKKKFTDHPELEVPDNDDVNKNFGFSLYAEFDTDDEVASY
jgi:hypothetical protein